QALALDQLHLLLGDAELAGHFLPRFGHVRPTILGLDQGQKDGLALFFGDRTIGFRFGHDSLLGSARLASFVVWNFDPGRDSHPSGKGGTGSAHGHTRYSSAAKSRTNSLTACSAYPVVSHSSAPTSTANRGVRRSGRRPVNRSRISSQVGKAARARRTSSSVQTAAPSCTQ